MAAGPIYKILILIASFVGIGISTQGLSATSEDGVWEDIPETAIPSPTAIARKVPPGWSRTLQADLKKLKNALKRAPREEEPGPAIVIAVPLPDGEFERFLVEESPIMDPSLAEKFPEIKTYIGRSLDDSSVTARFDVTQRGFHAIFHSHKGVVYIDPHEGNFQGGNARNARYYRSYFKRRFKPAQNKNFECEVEGADSSRSTESPQSFSSRPASSEVELRTYRAAIAATGEYTQFHGGTVADAMAAITTTMNRVNFIYERELAIRLVLVPDNDLIVYTDKDNDPYTGNSSLAMLDENQANLDAVIGDPNYDIGHVFSAGGGGHAFRASVCQAGDKAKGVTGTSNPAGDPFDVDFVAHEMGHQFGANHTFNGTAGACTATARNGLTAYEPGSGSTIMSYVGICDEHNLQEHSDAYFHGVSYDEIMAYTNAVPGGGECPVITSTLNRTPSVNAGSSFIIPVNTPFALTGSATDPDDDPLFYGWEQFDLGPPGDPTNPSGDAPIFRSFTPTDDPSRTFPQLSDVLDNTVTVGELLPTYGRTLTFRLIARDNYAGGGGVGFDTVILTVDDLTGPFEVTSPNSAVTWDAHITKLIEWDVAGTDEAPVNCPQVNILLSTDGGENFSTMLAEETPNDGSASVQVPNIPTAAARIKVECANNVFFDISDANFTINGGTSDLIFADGFEF